MSREFASERIRLNVVDLENGTTNPNAAAVADPIGSLWFRNGTYPATPTEIYYKLNASATFGWVKQNVVNLKVFNVKNFGAVGDGVTSDNAAIQAAITAAVAVGGGTIYFPPASLGYAVYRIIGQLAIFEISNQSNLTFQGDGAASLIKFTGDVALATCHVFRVFNQSQRVVFTNLGWDASTITNPNAASQNHFIQVSSSNVDVSPPHDVDVEENFFGTIRGTCVRVLGEIGFEPFNVRVLRNICDGANNGVDSRSFVEAQRDSLKVQVHHNWVTGIKNTPIDFEPTGATVENSPTSWSILGNILDTVTTEAITLGGWSAAHQADKNLCLYNIAINGNIQGLDINNMELRGNIVTQNNANVESCLHFFSKMSQCAFVGNILISQNTTGDRPAISLFADASGAPVDNIIADNICSSQTAAAVNPGLFLTTCNRVVVMGNLVYHNSTPAANFGVLLRATLAVGNQWCVVGNLVVGTGTAFTFAIDLTTGGNNDLNNVLCSYNYTRGGNTGIGFDTSGGKVFNNWRAACNNNCVGVTVQTVSMPSTNVGATVDGTAGPGPQIDQLNLAAGPETKVTAPVGSICLNQGGATPAIFNYKESGTGNTGWVTYGADPFGFGSRALTTATAARFLAPGIDLVTEGTVEIQLPMIRPGTLRNIRVHHGIVGTGGGNITYTVRKNAVNTTLAVTIANTVANGNATTNVVVVAGDLISLQTTKAATQTTPPVDVEVSFEIA